MTIEIGERLTWLFFVVLGAGCFWRKEVIAAAVEIIRAWRGRVMSETENKEDGK